MQTSENSFNSSLSQGLELLRTDSESPDFRGLVAKLDAYLAKVDGEDHAFYAQYNKIDMIRHVIVAYLHGKPAGCGAFKPFTEDSVEIKRMYVDPELRKRGIATAVLAGLELWAKESGFSGCVLETGKRQKEAVSLYQQRGYRVIPNYGQYIGVEDSICMQKEL